MKPPKSPAAILLFAAITLFGCGPAPKDAKSPLRTIVDPAGRSVKIPEKVGRAVCVGAGALRCAAYAGAADRIVGVEEGEGRTSPAKCFSYVFREVFSRLPTVGRNGAPDAEAVAALAPDVVITTYPPGVAEALQRRTGIPVASIPLPENPFGPEMFAALETVGEIFGTQSRCKSLAKYIRECETDLKRRTADVPESRRPTAYAGGISYRGARGFCGTDGAYPPFDASGVRNAAGSLGIRGAFEVDLEKVLEWDPQYLFIEINNIALVEDFFKKRPRLLDLLSAAREGRVYSNVAFRFGGTNAEAAIANAYYVGSVAYSERFSDVDIARKADEIFVRFLGVPLYGELKRAGLEFRRINLGGGK